MAEHETTGVTETSSVALMQLLLSFGLSRICNSVWPHTPICSHVPPEHHLKWNDRRKPVSGRYEPMKMWTSVSDDLIFQVLDEGMVLCLTIVCFYLSVSVFCPIHFLDSKLVNFFFLNIFFISREKNTKVKQVVNLNCSNEWILAIFNAAGFDIYKLLSKKWEKRIVCLRARFGHGLCD